MGVISAADETMIELFSGLSARQFTRLVRQLRAEGADPALKGRPWKLAFEDRVLLVAIYWRTNLTMRQLAALFGTSKSTADRVIDDLAPKLALRHRKRYAPETVLIVDGTLVPPGTTPSQRSRRTTGTRPTTRSSSMPTLSSSSPSAPRFQATATTRRHSASPASTTPPAPRP
jgi:hypothetical protein